jgi:hypothetical protein
MERDTHSRFAPSKSDRWANCQLSLEPVASEHFVAEVDREDAGLGSACHALGAACLNENAQPADFLLDDRTFHNRDVTVSMVENASVYVRHVRETYIDRGYEWFVEHHVEAPGIHEDCYGTTDFRAFSEARKHLAMVDYKSGHTIVQPTTYQLAIYASGEVETLLDMGYDIQTISCVVVQPADVDDPIKEHRYDVKSLRKVARMLKEATKGNAAKAGEHCKYCPHAHYCETLANYANEVLPGPLHSKEDFDGMVTSLTPELLSEILDRQSVVGIWFAAVANWAAQLAMLGTEIPGYELKEGLGHRRYSDPATAESVLKAEFGDDIYEPRVLRSPAQIEDIWPKAKSLMKGRPGKPGLTHRPPLGPRLKRKEE